MGVFVLVLGAVLIAPYWAGLSTLAAPLQELGNDSHHHARSLTSLLCWLAGWFGPAAENATYGAARIAGQLLFLVAAVRAALRVRSVEDVFHEPLVFLLVVDLLLAPWFQSWYVTWLLPLATRSVERVRRARFRRGGLLRRTGRRRRPGRWRGLA